MRLFRRGEPDSTLRLLVVGLGNPGREHARDRHNVGWMVVDEIAERHQGTFRGKFSGRLCELRLGAYASLDHAQLQRQGDEPLLRSVVEVALEPPPLRVAGGDDPLA